MVKVLSASKIIIWGECTMAHKPALETLNRTLKDIRNDSRCFGGAMILLSGDFRQILLVIPRSTAAGEINACLKSSNLWRYANKLQLTTNMRVAFAERYICWRFLWAIADYQQSIPKTSLLTTIIKNGWVSKHNSEWDHWYNAFILIYWLYNKWRWSKPPIEFLYSRMCLAYKLRLKVGSKWKAFGGN